ncbi:E2 domain-associated cysteine-rich protein [Azospirillum griseum]|uniref:E2 domain-associated cysteine-rich protein n=1 Tax=Azospirillum griseum TaxID=2496639 RepID=UPI00362CE0D8
MDGRRIVAKAKGTKEEHSRLVNMRRPCPCGTRDKRHRPVSRRGCADHAKKLIELIDHIVAMQEAEARYFAAWHREGGTCCGTLDNCPLKVTKN